LFSPPKNLEIYKILPSGNWLKLSNGNFNWINNTLNFTLRDNSIYDLDPNVGIIRDPIVIAVKDNDVPMGESGASKNGSGGGCSISPRSGAGLQTFIGGLLSIFVLACFRVLKIRKVD